VVRYGVTALRRRVPCGRPCGGGEIQDGDGTVVLNLATEPFNGLSNNYLDTLHADYAFIITPQPFVKSLRHPAEAHAVVQPDLDFLLYPNPTRAELNLQFQDDAPKEVTITDATGRLVKRESSIRATRYQLTIDTQASGIYWVRVSDGHHAKM
jgi:hypothetical protein